MKRAYIGFACLAIFGASACGSSASEATPATASKIAPAARVTETTLQDLRKMNVRGYHLIKKPVVLIQTRKGKVDFGAQVIARFNRIPRKLKYGSGRDVNFIVQGEGGQDGSETFGAAKRRCYSNFIGQDNPPPFVARPVDGQIVPLRVRIGGAGTIRLRAAVHVFEGGSTARELTEPLGCRP